MSAAGRPGRFQRPPPASLLFDVLHAAKGRADTPPDSRRPFWVFLDEVQTYDGAASGNLAGLLEQSAKYGVRAFLLNQNPGGWQSGGRAFRPSRGRRARCARGPSPRAPGRCSGFAQQGGDGAGGAQPIDHVRESGSSLLSGGRAEVSVESRDHEQGQQGD